MRCQSEICNRALSIDQNPIDRHRNFRISRKPPDFLLAEHPLAIDNNVENAPASGDQFNFNIVLAVLLDQFGHQTGGLRLVVSLAAIGDLNVHGPLLFQSCPTV